MIVLIRQKNSGDNYLLHSILDSVFGQIRLADLITVSMRAVALACDSMMLHFLYITGFRLRELLVRLKPSK